MDDAPLLRHLSHDAHLSRHCITKSVVENAHDSGQEADMAHPANMRQARLRLIENEPFIQQMDILAPTFKILAIF